MTEAADDICYRIIDIEDATELNILSDDFMFERFSHLLDITPVQDPDRYRWYLDSHFRQRNSILRAKLMTGVVAEIVETFQVHYDSIMNAEFDYKSSLIEASTGDYSKAILEVYDSITDKLFLSRRKAVLELGAQNSIGALLQQVVSEVVHFCTGKKTQNKDKIKTLLGNNLIQKIQVDQVACPYLAVMTALDYVTGMSDHYATEVCRKLLGFGF